MKLTIEQALQKGIKAHKEGKYQDAERLYRVILQSQPQHPDANHNLGLLAVSANKAQKALPLFKVALETNPKIDQFWLSYIDTLIKESQFELAKQVIEQAKKWVKIEKKINALEARLNSSKEQESVGGKSPSETELSKILEYFEAGRYDETEKLALSITQEFPKHQFSWKVLGIIFGLTDRKSEAVNAIQKAIALFPQDAEAHCNLANVLQDLGQLVEAETSYKKAIAIRPAFAEAHYNFGTMLEELDRVEESEASYKQAVLFKPDFAEAYNNLGNTLNKLGRLEEAEVSLRKAITLKPNYAQAQNNLGNTLKELGRLKDAVHAYIQALSFKPDLIEANTNLGLVLNNITFKVSNRDLYPIFINLLTAGNFVNPNDVARSILSLLRHDPLIIDLLNKKNLIKDQSDIISAIASLNKIPLLHHLMRICPIPDLQLEELFLTIRKILLTYIDDIKLSPELIYFLSTLSLQSFTNEYIYYQSDEEIELIKDLEMKIERNILQSKQPQLIELLCLSSYRPLHHYDWCEKLNILDDLKELKIKLIEQPIAEKKIAKNIPILGEVSDEISLKVREQYEDNPYPRWIKVKVPLKAKSVSEVYEDIKLKLYSDRIKDITSPHVLIAGCGTGQHSIQTASRFSNCEVLAIDLSLSSLAYAQRKTNELGLKNLNYLQADILNLGQLGREFDIIESSGVLHHMNEPMHGWRVLKDLLKPGGMMNIGLYSEFARDHIKKARKEILSLGVNTSENEMRKFRHSLGDSNNNHFKIIENSIDFFSLSSLRDLIFHSQEHHFTLLKIQDCLDELGLKFCGFENNDIVSSFIEFHENGSSIYDLDLWHHFEKSNPHVFSGMYQFWCQKI